MTDIHLSTDLESVDWTKLRQALIDDDFDNGRTPEEYERSARGSHLNVYAYRGNEIVGNARLLSDGVCNGYVVDVWTRSDLRRQGIGEAMMERLLAACEGQHVYLFTDDMEPFYESLGFKEQPTGMSKVVGTWLNRSTAE
ncbi:N-acetyltransferase [bacterium]|nr:MAG: N-acetyltransferase [bacterium]